VVVPNWRHDGGETTDNGPHNVRPNLARIVCQWQGKVKERSGVAGIWRSPCYWSQEISSRVVEGCSSVIDFQVDEAGRALLTLSIKPKGSQGGNPMIWNDAK
jgi:hypothetical protein